MKHVLVVDDDFDICDVLQLLLEPRYRVSIAHDGRQGLAVLDRERIDVVVLDLMMPVMDGDSFLRELHVRGVRVPVVVASAVHDLAGRAQAIGADAWLKKPFDVDVLERNLERLTRGEGSGGGGDDPTGSTGSFGMGEGSPGWTPRRGDQGTGAPRCVQSSAACWTSFGRASGSVAHSRVSSSSRRAPNITCQLSR